MGEKLGWAERRANWQRTGGCVQGKIEQAIAAGQRDIGGALAGAALGTARNMQPPGDMRCKAAGKIAGFNRGLRAAGRAGASIDMQQLSLIHI